MILLQTKRLILRPLLESDLSTFAAYRSDPEVARYQSWNTPYSIQQAKSLFDQMILSPVGTPGEWFSFGITLREEPVLIGDCAFKIEEQDKQQAQIGCSLSLQYQKQGFAAEAVKRLLDYLFNEYNLHRIIAICDVDNIPSTRLIEHLGMRREAHFIENIWFKGGWGSEYSYALLRREWGEKYWNDLI